MKNLKILPIINTIIIIALLLFVGFNMLNGNKTEIVYVDNIRLFNAFNMTKEIRSIKERKITNQNRVLDSIYSIYQDIDDKESGDAKTLQSKISKSNKTLQDLQSNYTNNIPSQVWVRLNSYLKEYGKQQNLKIIFGTSGNGNIMFAEENINITEQLIEYINERYEGKTLNL